MKVYRVHHYTQGGESAGYSYYSNKIEAEKAQREANKEGRDDEGDKPHPGEVDVKDVEISKQGILDILNHWGEHPDNG